MVQALNGIQALLGSTIPGQGTRSHIPQIRVYTPQPQISHAENKTEIPCSATKNWSSQTIFFSFKGRMSRIYTVITLTQEYPTSHSACPQSHGISPSINLSPITPEMRVALDSSFGGGHTAGERQAPDQGWWWKLDKTADWLPQGSGLSKGSRRHAQEKAHQVSGLCPTGLPCSSLQ